MSLQFASTTVLPLLLIVIMFGLGLTLTIADFRRVLLFPRPILVGLSCQMLFLPMVAFGLCYLFQLSSPFAIGLMLLAASPGGPTSSLFSKMTGGDVPLNLTLTAVNSALSPIMLPLITTLAIAAFAEVDKPLGFEFRKVIEVFLLIIIPVSIGMVVHHRWPILSKRIDRPIQSISVIALLLIVGAATTKEWATLTEHLSSIGAAVLTFNLLSLATGYFVPRTLKFSKAQSIAITFEIGIHSAGLALFVAMSSLGSPLMAVPAMLYGILMYFTAGIAITILRKTKETAS